MEGVGMGLFLFILKVWVLFFLSNSVCSGQKNSCNSTSNGALCSQSKTGDCVGYKKNLLTLEDKNYLLWVHNSLRENLTNEVNKGLPKAFFMKKLVWNEALAKMAQKWAENCSATKQPHLLFQNQLVGQLVLTVDRNMGKNLADVVHKWTDGLDFLDSQIIAQYQEPTSTQSDYEPVAQMIWWNTSQLGCGRSSYELKKCNEKNANCEVTELVCNYFPAGNREGEPVYLTEKNNNFLCQYDSKHELCKNLDSTRKNLRQENSESDSIEIRNRIKQRIQEFWPSQVQASSAREKWAVPTFYVLLFLTTFNMYENLLQN